MKIPKKEGAIIKFLKEKNYKRRKEIARKDIMKQTKGFSSKVRM